MAAAKGSKPKGRGDEKVLQAYVKKICREVHVSTKKVAPDVVDRPLQASVQISGEQFDYLSPEVFAILDAKTDPMRKKARAWRTEEEGRSQMMSRVRKGIIGGPKADYGTNADAMDLAYIHFEQFMERQKRAWCTDSTVDLQAWARFKSIEEPLRTVFIYVMATHYIVLMLELSTFTFSPRLAELGHLLRTALMDDRLAINQDIPKPATGGEVQPLEYWQHL